MWLPHRGCLIEAASPRIPYSGFLNVDAFIKAASLGFWNWAFLISENSNFDPLNILRWGSQVATISVDRYFFAKLSQAPAPAQLAGFS